MSLDRSYRDAFLAAYKEAAEWSSTHMASEGADPVPMDSLGLDWSPAAEAQARVTCGTFITDNETDLEGCGLPDHTAGYCLWLDAAGHGAGFWDRDIGDAGDRLSDASEPYHTDLYVGDDNLLYLL